jgi:hypothetical protein
MPEGKRTNTMTFERRDFIKIGSAGLAVGLVNPRLQLTEASAAAVSGELESGTGSLRLKGRLKSGTLILETQDFVQGLDRTVISHGTLNSKRFYCAMFSHNLDRTVFALLRDEDHSTTLVFSDSDVAEIGRLIVWHDAAVAESFRIKKQEFLKKEIIVDEQGKAIDFVGKRKPLDFTPKELEEVFGKNPALLKFMRGKRSYHDPPPDQELLEWICRILSKLPGSTFGLYWAAQP